MSETNLGTFRTRLPSPMVSRDQVSIWSILKNCIGKELSKITMPVVFNEPLTMLQRACEGIQYTNYLQLADMSDDPVRRMELICAFVVAGLSSNCHRIYKPFNPLLYETFEYDHELDDGSHVRALSQQVSHHPPITAIYCESDNFIYNGSVNPKIKFWGRSVEIQPDGQCRIFLKRHQESYIFNSVSCSIHNIIVGKLWFEHTGPLDITCAETKLEANLVFKGAGWFSNDLHKFNGYIVNKSDNDKDSKKTRLRFVYGKWSDYIKSVDYSEYEKFVKSNPQKQYKISDQANSCQDIMPSSSATNGTKSKSDTLSDESEILWQLDTQYLKEYYNFTPFTMRLNELNQKLSDDLPKTDSRFRLDVRKLEEGDLDGAANEKQRLEEKQRNVRAKDSRFETPSPDYLWFDLKLVPESKDKYWIYKGGYWDNKGNADRFPDLY